MAFGSGLGMGMVDFVMYCLLGAFQCITYILSPIGVHWVQFYVAQLILIEYLESPREENIDGAIRNLWDI